MHVRWERRKTNEKGRRAQYQLVALFVKGHLSDNNEHARVLAQLGSIQERFLTIRISRTRAFHQGLFWAKVDKKLKKFDLDKETYHTLEYQISEKVPRPRDDWALWGVTCIPHIDC